MASFEASGLADEIKAETYRLVRNMRRNASDYIAKANGGFDITKLRTIMLEDATQFRDVRIARMTALAQRNPTLFSDALATMGLQTSDATALRTQLIATLNHTLAATLNSVATVNAEAQFILDNTPSWDGMF